MASFLSSFKQMPLKGKLLGLLVLIFILLVTFLTVYQVRQKQIYKGQAADSCLSSKLTQPSNISVVETVSGLNLSWSIVQPGDVGYVNVSSQPEYYSSFTPMAGTQRHTASGVFLVKGNQYAIVVSNYCANSVPADFASYVGRVTFTATGVSTATSTPTPTPKITPTPTPKPIPGCNQTCSTQTQCSAYGLQCAYGRCRSKSCPLKTDCRCF